MLTSSDEKYLEKTFKYHAPKEGQADRYTHLRETAQTLAREVLEHVPYSRERSEALIHLENAVMWANAGIARNE